MGFGGAVRAMITSLKNNARPKRKAFDSIKHHQPYPKVSKKLQDKHFSDDRINQVKQEIKAQAKRDRIIKNVTIIVVMMLIAIGSVLLFKYKLRDTLFRPRMSDWKKEQIHLMDSVSIRKDSIYLECINQGCKYLDQKDYQKAKDVLYRAYEIKPKQFDGLYLYTKACVLDCQENNIGCKSATANLKYLKSQFPDHADVELLELILNDQ